jgi:hypothetical protein
MRAPLRPSCAIRHKVDVLDSLARLIRTLLVAAAGVVACTQLVDVDLPPDAVAFRPLESYARWWSLVETCAAKPGNLQRIRWYMVPGAFSVPLGDKGLVGYWLPVSNSIVMAGASIRDAAAIRHEMLHALLHDANHDARYFRDLCGGIVACAGQCAVDVAPGTEIPLSSTVVTPADLRVAVEISPTSPAASDTGAGLTVIVSATNPRSEAVWVDLIPFPQTPLSPTFGMMFDEKAGPSYTFVPDVRMPFRAGETKRLAFDKKSYLPGRYALRGWFNAETTAVVPVIIKP